MAQNQITAAYLQALAASTAAAVRASSMYLQALGVTAGASARLSTVYLQAMGNAPSSARLSDTYLQVLVPLYTGRHPRARAYFVGL